MKKLIGSEKQVKWAEEIRKDMMQTIETFFHNDFKEIIETLETLKKQGITLEEVLEKAKGSKVESQLIELKKLQERKAKIEQQEEAKWFIDNRNNFSWI